MAAGVAAVAPYESTFTVDVLRRFSGDLQNAPLVILDGNLTADVLQVSSVVQDCREIAPFMLPDPCLIFYFRTRPLSVNSGGGMSRVVTPPFQHEEGTRMAQMPPMSVTSIYSKLAKAPNLMSRCP